MIGYWKLIFSQVIVFCSKLCGIHNDDLNIEQSNRYLEKYYFIAVSRMWWINNLRDRSHFTHAHKTNATEQIGWNTCRCLCLFDHWNSKSETIFDLNLLLSVFIRHLRWFHDEYSPNHIAIIIYYLLFAHNIIMNQMNFCGFFALP